jgi:membrane associated rhomboid family serine protease
MTDPLTSLGDGEPPASTLPGPGHAGPLDSDVAVSLLQRAQALAEQGDWALAASTFGRVVGNADPAIHVAALLGLAESRYRLDDEPGALQAWISATQAPETPLMWRAWQALAAARVRSDDMTGALRAYREAERRAPATEQAAIAARIGWLSKELGDESAARRAFGRSRTGSMPQPVVTWSLLAVTVGVGISMFLLGQADLWLDLFALDKVALAEGEVWRLVSPVLVHGSLIHLGFNMYALWIIGPIVETLYGSARFAAIYLLCAAAGSVASYVFSDARFSVGASGAVFGLFGVLLVADRVHKPALTRGARNLTMQIGLLIGVNLLIGLTVPRIDNAAHLGGLVAGAWLGFVLVPRGATMLSSFWSQPGRTGGPTSPTPGVERDPSLLLRLAGVGALVGAIVLGLVMGPIMGPGWG